MGKLIIKKLEVENFRNIEKGTFEFTDGINIIGGKNQIGKTNLLNAISFLLTDTLLYGNNDLTSMKPNENLNALVSVNGTFDLNGKELTIKKTYQTKMDKTGNYVGNVEKYYINDIERTTLKQFNQDLTMTLGLSGIETRTKVDLFQAMSNPFYIGDLSNSNKWKELQALLYEMGINVEDSEVISQSEQMNVLNFDMHSRTYSELKLYYDQQTKLLTQKIQELNVKKGTLLENSKIDDKEVEQASEQKEKIEAEIFRIRESCKNENYFKDIDTKINAAKLDAAQLRSQEILEYTNSIPTNNNAGTTIDKINDLSNKMQELFNTRNDYERTIAQLKAKLTGEVVAQLKTERETLLLQFNDLKKESEKNEKIERCPVCGALITEENKKEVLSKTNALLNETINKVVARGIAIKAKIEKLENQDAITNKQIDELTEKASQLENAIQANQESLDAVKASAQVQPIKAFTASDTLIQKEQIIDSLENERNEMSEKQTEYIASCQKKLVEINALLEPINKVLVLAENKKMVDESIKQINEQIQAINDQKSTIEFKTVVLKQFINIKKSLILKKVKNVFKNVEWKFIQENIKEDSFQEVCTPLIIGKNVEYEFGSQSEKIITGISILEDIKKKLDYVSLPILFDEGAELDSEHFKALNTDSQIICVKVNDDDTIPTIKNI